MRDEIVLRRVLSATTVLDRLRDVRAGWRVLAEAERVQELVNEDDLLVVRVGNKMAEPFGAHVNHPASWDGKRGHAAVPSALKCVVGVDVEQLRQQGRLAG